MGKYPPERQQPMHEEHPPHPHQHPQPDATEDRMLKWFDYAHLPHKLQAVSMGFNGLAKVIIDIIEPGPERTVALRKLLESKDAAVRATVHPGG